LREKALPEISISLPVYNGERYLASSIESALAQTFGDFELLIVDDCSTDHSAEIVESYARNDNRIVYWRNESNLGLFANYNEAQSRAQGKFIKPFAQDDIWDPTILEKMHLCFVKHPTVALASVSRNWVSGDGDELPTYREFDENKLLPGREVIRDSLLRLVNWIGEPSTVMYPRAIAGTGFDSKFYHLGDLDYWLRLVEHGDFFYLNEPLCQFRRHEGSTTNKNLKGLLFAVDMLLLGERNGKLLAELGISEREFAFNAVSTISTYVNHLTNRDEMSLSELLAVKPKTLEQARSQLDQFKALSYFALLALAEDKAVFDVKLREFTDAKHSVEQELSTVLDSRWWKTTEPLRAVARRLQP
jgi:glycosyltransferase involved in cell wall biosynthesis